MSKPKKMGRPKLPDGEARKVFPIRVSDKERAHFQNAAAIEALSLPDWVRKTLTERADEITSRSLG